MGHEMKFNKTFVIKSYTHIFCTLACIPTSVEYLWLYWVANGTMQAAKDGVISEQEI